jgi:hypothetical protein
MHWVGLRASLDAVEQRDVSCHYRESVCLQYRYKPRQIVSLGTVDLADRYISVYLFSNAERENEPKVQGKPVRGKHLDSPEILH